MLDPLDMDARNNLVNQEQQSQQQTTPYGTIANGTNGNNTHDGRKHSIYNIIVKRKYLGLDT